METKYQTQHPIEKTHQHANHKTSNQSTIADPVIHTTNTFKKKKKKRHDEEMMKSTKNQRKKKKSGMMREEKAGKSSGHGFDNTENVEPIS